MSNICYVVLVCMFSILFKPTSTGPVAEINNPEYVSKNDVINESEYNKKLVKHMFNIFSTIPNGFDPSEDPQLKIKHKKPSVICWTHIVTKMKNYEGDVVDQICEYAISFESPTNPNYSYVLNSDPDVYGNTRTFFITPPEIIYRNKDHIVEKNKYITCSFSSQYHKSYSKLPDGNVEIKIVRNKKISESGRFLDNYTQEETVTKQIPTVKPAATINVYPEYHQVGKKNKPVMHSTLNCNNNEVDNLSNDNNTADKTRRMTVKSSENTNEESSAENLSQPVTHCAENITKETTVENKHIIEPTNESLRINDDIEPYSEVFPIKRIELVPSDDLTYKQHQYCQNINSHIRAIGCPADIISVPLINELHLPYYVYIEYSDIMPDFIEANQMVVIGQRQCYLFDIVGETECPRGDWSILTIYEPIKDDEQYFENYPDLTGPEIQKDEDYSFKEQSAKTTVDKNHSMKTPVPITEKPETHPIAKPTTNRSVDSFLIRITKSNAPKDENNIMEKCLEIDVHVSVIQCPPQASLLPTINERILPNTVILNYLEDTPDIDDNKLIVRGEIFCYVFKKIYEIPCPNDELFTVLEAATDEPITTISATTNEVFEDSQPETVTENNVPETTTNRKPEGFILRIAEVKIDSSEKETNLKVICKYIDNHIYEQNCPSEISDLSYFDEHLFPNHVELDHIDPLPEISDKMLILRGNKYCYVLNMVNTTNCPSDPTNLLTLTIIYNDEVESLESSESESEQELERKNSSPKPDDTNKSKDESEEDCDYVSTEDERINKIQSTTMMSYDPKYLLVRLIDIVSFDKVAVTCYNVEKYITLLDCPKTSEKISEFDVEKLPSDTIILDETGKEVLLSRNQMMVKGKGYCYALTKLNVEKCPPDGQRRMLNIIDCNIDSNARKSLNTEPINRLENLLNFGFPVAFEVMHISQLPSIPTFITTTCENINRNIGIVKCPTGFFRIPIVNESLLSKYPKHTYTNMPELNESMMLARGKRVCYILEKIGKIECPKDLNKIVRILTHEVIENPEPRMQNIESVTKRLDETRTKISSSTTKPIDEEPRSSTGYLQEIVPNTLHEITTEITSSGTKETVFGEDENSTFLVAIKVLHIPLESNISSYLTVTCKNVNSNVAVIDCPTEFEQIPILNDQLLSKSAKQIIHKNITEFSENMLLVRGKKNCYILDQVGEIECPKYLNKIVKIFKSQVIQPADIQTSTGDIKNTANKLHETTAKISSTTSNPEEVESRTLTKYLQDIEPTTNKLYENTAKISPTSSRPLYEEPKSSMKYLQDIETTTNKLYGSTAKISSTGRSLEDIETITNKSHETTVKIISTTSKPEEENFHQYLQNIETTNKTATTSKLEEEEPGTSTKYLQDTETTTNKLHETTTKIASTSSRPIEEEPRTSTEYLQDIENTINKLHETITKIPTTSSRPIEEDRITSREYQQDIERVTNKLDKTTTEIISTTSRPTEVILPKDENITFPVAFEILHISPNLTISTHLTITCENINSKITVINCPSEFQTIPAVNENLLPEYTKQEFHNTIPEINDNMFLVRGKKVCYIFDKIGKIDCPEDMSKIIRILKYEVIEPVKWQKIKTTTEVPTTPGESSEEIILTDEETFPIAVQVEHISTQSKRPSYVIAHCENINRIINVIKCPKGFKKFPVVDRKLLTKYITEVIPMKKPQFNDSMLLVRGNKGCYILHRIGEINCPKNMNNILKIVRYNSTEYLPNINITTETYNSEMVSENSPTSDKINYEQVTLTESTLYDSENDGTSTESKTSTSNSKVTEASTIIDNKITSEATTIKVNSENDEQNNEDNTGSTLHTTPDFRPTTAMMNNEYNHESGTTKSIELTTVVKDNTIASTATNIPETHQEETTTGKTTSETNNNLAITVSSTTEQTTIDSNLSSLESSTLSNTNDINTETVIADETIPTSSTNVAISTSVSDNEVTEMSQPNHELTTVRTTTETETTSPIATETTSPIVTETTSAIITETTSPIVTKRTSPIVTETTSQIVTETTSPTVNETTSPIVTETTSQIFTETTSPNATERTNKIVTETASPIATETTSSNITETTSPNITETTSPTVTEITSPIVTERTSAIVTEITSPNVTEINSPIVTETTSPTVTETTSSNVTEKTSPNVTEINSPIVTKTTSPVVIETTSAIITENSPSVTETTSPTVIETSQIVTETSTSVTETTSQNINDKITEYSPEKEIETSTDINTSKQPNETTIIDSVTETKSTIMSSSTETSDLPDDTIHITASTPDSIADNSHSISDKLTTPNTDKSQLTEDYTERYTILHSTTLWDDTSSDLIDTSTTNYEVTTIAEKVERNTDTTDSKFTTSEHTSVSDTDSTDSTPNANEKTTTEKENEKYVITKSVVDTTTTDNTVTDIEEIITEKSIKHIPIKEKTVLVHQIVSSTNTPVQTEVTTESLFSNTWKEENTKYTTVPRDTININTELNESTTNSVHELTTQKHVEPVTVQNISTLPHSTIYEDVTTEKSKNKVVNPNEANTDTEEEDDDDYNDDEPVIDDDLSQYLLKNKLHGKRRSEFLLLKKRGKKNKRLQKFKEYKLGYTSKARIVPIGEQIRSNVHYNTESYTSTEKKLGHATAHVKIYSPNNNTITKTQQQNYTTVIYKSGPIQANSSTNRNIQVAVRVNNNNDDISTRPVRSVFPVKITNVFGPELTQMVCKYMDKNIKLINISTEIANLPFINDALLPRDVKIEYHEKLPHIMGNKNLLVRGMVYYYLLKEYNTIPCPENTNNFVPITMYYYGIKPTTPVYDSIGNKDSEFKVLNKQNSAVRKESDVQRLNYNDNVMNSQMSLRRQLTKFDVKFTIVGAPGGHNYTLCGHIEENMTVVDETGHTETMSIGVISSKERLYYHTYIPLQLPKNSLAIRSNDLWYVFRGYKEFKCPEDTSIFITLTLHYNDGLRRAKSVLPHISHFPVKIINISNPNNIQITCKLMESNITQLNTTLKFENVPFMNISVLPANVIINYSDLSSIIIDDKNSLVFYNGNYYILKEYKTIECPENTENFVPIISYQNDVSLTNANERNWKYALGESQRTNSAFLQSATQHTNVETQTATLVHKIQPEDYSEIIKPILNVDDELSVIPLVQEEVTQPRKEKFVPLNQKETRDHSLSIVHTLVPSKPEQVAILTKPKSYVTNDELPDSTEGPMLPTPEYLSAVVVKHNNVENKEECYEVNNRMQVNKIPCPRDTSTIPHVINPEFMKLLCPKKLRPKLKYMTGLGILKKLNMIIHDPSKQKNIN